MFIKKLYRYNKVLGGLFTLYIISFVVINYKWGLVATPVLQYGMYSSILHINDTQTVFRVEADHVPVNNAGASLTNRDILQIYPDIYARQQQINEDAFATMKKYVGYTGLSSGMTIDRYTNRITDSVFLRWYAGCVQRTTGKPVSHLTIYKQDLTWQNNRLQPAGMAVKLYSIGN